MTDTEREALEKAIKLYLDMGILGRVCQSTEKFLARVPGISTQRLQSLIKNHESEIAVMAGAKNVVYKVGDYKPSGRGLFGRKGGGERAVKISPSIEFIF